MGAVLRSLMLVVGIPTLLATIYFGLLASDIYVSEARFAVRSSSVSGGETGLLAALATPLGGSSSQETLIMTDYVHSRDMLEAVQERLDVRKHYSSRTIDWLARLDTAASEEETLEYFIEQIEMVREPESDVITLKVRAFRAGQGQGARQSCHQAR